MRLGARLALPGCLPGFGKVLLGLDSVFSFTLALFVALMQSSLALFVALLNNNIFIAASFCQVRP